MSAGQDGKTKLLSLELGRFMAAAMVMLSHVAPYVNGHAAPGARPVFGNMLFPGPLGVQYFFVLSGFVMASTHHADFGKISSPLKFWWRRACRIYPAYWLALCIPAYYLFGAMTPRLTLQLVTLSPWHDLEYIPAAWTLRYEMAFYIMFGLCMLPYVGRLILALWVAATVGHCLWLLGMWLLGFVFHPHFILQVYNVINNAKWVHFVAFMEFYFFAGLAAGYGYVKCRFGRKAWGGVLAGGLVLLLVLLPGEQWGVTYGPSPAFALRMACVLAVALLGLAGLERAGGFALGRWAGWLGAISYPIYIFHEPTLLVITNELHPERYHTPGLYALLAAVTVAILAVATLVTFLFDQPVQRLLRRVGRGKRDVARLKPLGA